METPKKLVHWNFDSPSLSNLNSPFFNATYDSSMDSTSSLEFINSQLVAHGFVPSPGLSLSGISNDDSARVVKCLLGMLSQRMEDMSRTEELTTKLRTLSYDHERMVSMYRTASDKGANAEREMNLHKSRLAATLKTLQASENAHKQTTAELQRTRISLQGVRATHQAEIKKKEKEVDRIMEKWQKLAEGQTKLSGVPSGMRCANVAVVDGTEILGKGQGFLEIALDQAEKARAQLGDENLYLRKLVLKAVNEIQTILHQSRSLLPSESTTEPPIPFTMLALFPLSPPNVASDKLAAIFADFRTILETLSQPTAQSTATTFSAVTKPVVPTADIERLQGIITNLKEELARSQKQSIAHMTETQAMFDKFAEDHRIATGEIGDMSVELMTAPLKDEEKERLNILRKELDFERQKFTDAAIKFGKEKAALEAERIKFLDEKRSWQVEIMLADLPPTPAPALSPKKPPPAFTLSPKRSSHKSPHKSPRRSPAKNIAVGKVGSGRKAHRVSRKSLASPIKMVISYETEYMPPIPAPSFPSMKSLIPPSSLLSTSFVLPPPSPRASLPTKPALPPSLPDSPPDNTSTTPPVEITPPSASSESSSSLDHNPSTPPVIRRPFPVAKPFAQRMIHAYSPAKPSPLSRILMLGDSPLTPSLNMANPDNSFSPGVLETVTEELAERDLVGCGYGSQQEPQMSLAAELGVESPPDTPLQEKKVEPNVVTLAPVVVAPANLFNRGRVFHHPDSVAGKKTISATEKGKAKAVDLAPAPRLKRTSALGEKENSNSKGKKKPLDLVTGNVAGAARKVSPTGAEGKAAIPSRTAGKSLPAPSAVASAKARGPIKPPAPTVPGGGGPRRVLINSADAPPIGKGWKG